MHICVSSLHNVLRIFTLYAM